VLTARTRRRNGRRKDGPLEFFRHISSRVESDCTAGSYFSVGAGCRVKKRATVKTLYSLIVFAILSIVSPRRDVGTGEESAGASSSFAASESRCLTLFGLQGWRSGVCTL